MRNNLKHFLIGALLAALPMSIYGYLKLQPQTQIQVKIDDIQKDSGNKEKLSQILEPKITIEPKFQHKGQNPFISIDLTSNVKKEDTLAVQNLSPNPKPTIQPVTVEKLIVPVKTASYEIHAPVAPTDVAMLIDTYAAQYGVSKDMMVLIAKCESGFRSNAVSGPYAGIYQFVTSTWVSNRRAMGLDENPQLRFNAEEAVKTAAFKMSRDGFGAWPVCQNKARNLIGLNSTSI